MKFWQAVLLILLFGVVANCAAPPATAPVRADENYLGEPVNIPTCDNTEYEVFRYFYALTATTADSAAILTQTFFDNCRSTRQSTF